MANNWRDAFFQYKDFNNLIKNTRDPEEVVRIASLRALVRVAGLARGESRRELINRIKPQIRLDERDDVLGVSFLPKPRLLPQAYRILDSTDEDDRQRARELIAKLTHWARLEHDPEISIAREALDVIENPNPDRIFTFGPREDLVLRGITPKMALYLITSQFASLALLDFDDQTETHLAASERISHQIKILGSSFTPHIPSLFQVYQSFFRSSMQFWLSWLENWKKQGLNLVREMPAWFPMTEGPLAVARYLEWAVSRGNLSRVVEELGPQWQSSDPRDRWAAANLVEWAARYYPESDYPRFGGGVGPPDVLPDEDLATDTKRYRSVKGWVTEPDKTEPQRYTNLTIFNDHFYPGDDLSSATQVDETTPLVPGSLYTLEVAIRLKRKGIGSQFDPFRSIKNPRKDKEELAVFIVAESLIPSITIKEPFAKVVWPYDSDSTPAYFRLDVNQTGSHKGLIEVRLYDGSLDLLDIVQLTVPVYSYTHAGDLPAAKLDWLDQSEGELNIPVDNPPRRLSIDVGFNPESSTYKFLFKFLVNNKDVEIPGSSVMTADDVDGLLVKIRDFWTELVITNYSTELKVTRTTFSKYLTQLKDLGIQAWTLLFGDRYAAQKGASETISELLQSLRLNEGSHIQITYSNVVNFVFPWCILYPSDLEDTEVNPFEFWGARYQIEQVRDRAKHVDLTDVPVDLVFTLDPAFADSQSQKQLLKAYETTAQGKLNVTDPISGADKFFEALKQVPAAHLYYFYCHGYAPSGKIGFKRDAARILKERIEAIPENTPERAALETLWNLTSKMNDEPWIYIGNAEVKESKIKTQKFFTDKRPIVFLNMCQSADLMPTLSGGLVRVFLDHNASAVIGTESPMTGVFANAFAETFFDELFAGEDVGTSLWKARRRFLQDDMRNPLGLAYTLYGRALARLGNGPIITRDENQKHNGDSQP